MGVVKNIYKIKIKRKDWLFFFCLDFIFCNFWFCIWWFLKVNVCLIKVKVIDYDNVCRFVIGYSRKSYREVCFLGLLLGFVI